jgi:hypothetical protein
MFKTSWLLLAGITALTLSACNSPPPAPTVSRVVVSPASPVGCQVNGTVSFTAVAQDTNGNLINPQPVLAWASSLPSVASVDALTGVATCKTVGITNISAQAAGVTSEPSALTVADGVGRFDSAKFNESVFAP